LFHILYVKPEMLYHIHGIYFIITYIWPSVLRSVLQWPVTLSILYNLL